MNDWFVAHSLLCLLTLAALGTVFWVWSQRDRLRLSLPWVLFLSVIHVAIGVLCVKAFAILEAGSLSVAGNMSLFGAVFFLPLFYWTGAKLGKRNTAEVFDVFVGPMVFTLACARVNCLISGCCLGRPIAGTEFRWPTRELELVFYAILLTFFIVRTHKGRTGGLLYPIYMTAYGAFRFATEFFRYSSSDSLLHLSHLWAALCFLTGLSIYLELKRKKDDKSTTKQSMHRRKSQ